MLLGKSYLFDTAETPEGWEVLYSYGSMSRFYPWTNEGHRILFASEEDAEHYIEYLRSKGC